jgi:hypothetical protein
MLVPFQFSEAVERMFPSLQSDGIILSNSRTAVEKLTLRLYFCWCFDAR